MIRLSGFWRAAAAAATTLLTASLLLIQSSQPVSAQRGGFDPEYGFGSDIRQKKAFAYFKQAVEFEKIGDLTKALEFYRKSVGIYPKVKEAHHQMAQCLARLGDNERALAAFKTALNNDYNYVACRNNLGAFYRKLDKVNDAEREFKTCITIDPKYPFAHYNLGKIQHEKGDLQAAIESFKTATRLRPDFAEAYKELGLCIFERAQQGDITTAMEELQRASQLVPKNPVIHYHLGIIYCTKGNLDLGETEFRKALMCDSRMAAAHWELGKLRYFRGDLDRCLMEISQAESINPTYGETNQYPTIDLIKVKVLKADALEHRGELEKAYETYEELVKLRKGNAAYAEKMTWLVKEIRRGQKRKPSKKGPIFDPEEVESLVQKGISEYEDGRLDDAKAAFEKALELNPASALATINLSSVQEAQGDLNNAVASCQKAIALDPNYDGLVFNLGYLLEKMNLPSDAAQQYMNFHDMGGKYPYDPQHVIELQQDIIRKQKIEADRKKRGF
jgi:tetratricopeptide (TPR) repeat protein